MDVERHIKDWTIRNVLFNGERFCIDLDLWRLNKPDVNLFTLELGKYHEEIIEIQMQRGNYYRIIKPSMFAFIQFVKIDTVKGDFNVKER